MLNCKDSIEKASQISLAEPNMVPKSKCDACFVEEVDLFSMECCE